MLNYKTYYFYAGFLLSILPSQYSVNLKLNTNFTETQIQSNAKSQRINLP